MACREQLISRGPCQDGSCVEDVFSRGACKDEACRVQLFRIVFKERSCRELLCSRGACKGQTCRKDVFSRGSCNEKSCKRIFFRDAPRISSSGRVCLAEVLSRISHAGKMRRCLQGSDMRPPKCPAGVDKNDLLC